MNKLNFFKRTAVGLTAVLASFLISGGAAHAIPYTGDTTVASPVPAFNVFTGVPAPWGNESDFLRARVPTSASDSTTQYADPLNASCTDGQQIQMRVYVHNGASADNNQNGTGPSVAHGTNVKVSLPSDQTAADTFTPSATISATNAATVSDTTTINCNGQTVKLHYIPGSASQYSIGSGVVALNDNIVTSGVPIRSEHTDGDVWGCWNERVYVLLSVKVEVVPQTTPTLGECKAVDLTSDNTKRQVTVNSITADVTNAQVVGYKIDWGDNSTPSDKQSDTHTYANSGTYNVTASVQVKFADNHTEWKTATGCVKSVSFTAPGQPTPPPVTPKVLPNTGSGAAQIAGIFAAATAAGAIAHRFFLSRRFNS